MFAWCCFLPVKIFFWFRLWVLVGGCFLGLRGRLGAGGFGPCLVEFVECPLEGVGVSFLLGGAGFPEFGCFVYCEFEYVVLGFCEFGFDCSLSVAHGFGSLFVGGSGGDGVLPVSPHRSACYLIALRLAIT